MLSMILGFIGNILAAPVVSPGCAPGSFDAATCSTSFATPIFGALVVLAPLGVAIGLIARGVEGKESIRTIAIETLVGAIITEVVVQIIKTIAGA